MKTHMFTLAKRTTIGRSLRILIARNSIHAPVLLFVLLLSGCNRGKVEELQAENTKLMAELEMIQEQLKYVAGKQKQEAAARELEEAKRIRELAEQTENAKREQMAKKAQAIDKCFDRIDLQMKALMNEPRDFAFKNKAEREAIESRLKTFANSKQTAIGELIIELKDLGFPATSDLDFAIQSFVRNYISMIFHQRMSYDYIEIGSGKHAEQAAQSGKYMSEAFADMRKVGEIKRGLRLNASGGLEKP